MGAKAMVNASPYIALVDMNKCDIKRTSSGAAGATKFATAILDVTRAAMHRGRSRARAGNALLLE